MTFDIEQFKRRNVLVVGDLMIDEYLWGEVDRVSPEAPVQVVAVKSEEFILGGAGNVVNNLSVLGADVLTAGVIGDGENGRLLLREFERIGVDASGVIIEPGRYTTRKTRIIASGQHVLRVDRETIKDITDDTRNRLMNYIERNIKDVDVILISDYGKGLLTASLLSGVFDIANRKNKITIVDPKGMNFAKYAGASILTPNKKEASLASGISIGSEAELFAAGYRIMETSGIENLLITCGKDGMVVFEKERPPFKINTDARQVYDVSGAGDTVVSVLGLSMASGMGWVEAAEIANAAAGVVVGKVGAATVSPDELAASLENGADTGLRKHKRMEALLPILSDLRRRGQKIVLTNGCFDLLHAGHIRLFAESKKLGDVLIAAIDDDRSVAAIKGPGRPVIGEKERVSILCALDSIDYVVVFSGNGLQSLIEAIRPDILTKGGNYETGEVFGRRIVTQYGGEVVILPVLDNVSSTGIIQNIKAK